MTTGTGNFAELLWPGIHDKFGTSYDMFPTLYTRIAQMEKSDKAFEKMQGVTGFGLAAVKDQGQGISFVDPYQGYQREFVNTTYGIGATVTKEMWSDDQYNYINAIPGMLAESMRQTEETDFWNMLNNGFAGGATVELAADGLSVVNSAHPNVGGGTQSNVAATSADLSQTSLEALVQVLLDETDDLGLRVRRLPEALVVPTASNFTARKLLETDFVVGSADNDKNPLVGLFKDLIVCPYITDSDAWWIKTNAKNGLVWFTRWEREAERDNEFDTKNLKFTVTKRWSRGVPDWRVLYGNPGA